MLAGVLDSVAAPCAGSAPPGVAPPGVGVLAEPEEGVAPSGTPPADGGWGGAAGVAAGAGGTVGWGFGGRSRLLSRERDASCGAKAQQTRALIGWRSGIERITNITKRIVSKRYEAGLQGKML